MRMLRDGLGDRWTGGWAVGLVGWFLVLQLFVASFTCGLTVQAAGADGFVLCEPMRTGAAHGGGENRAHDCPCIVLSGSDLDAIPALAPGADLGPAFVDAGSAWPTLARQPSARHAPHEIGLVSPPRGPPPSSA